MYDWVKLATYNIETKAFLLNKSDLNFTTDINPDTGEIKPINEYGTIKRTALQHGMEFNIYESGRIEIKGSLHQFFNSVINDKIYNYNIFGLNDVVQAIEMLKCMYGIVPSETTIHNLETGINIKPCLDISVNDALNYVKAYKGLKFNSMDIKKEGKGKKVSLKQYKVKFYDKGVHQGANDDILRYEIGYSKMQALGRNLKLSDLTNTDLWVNLSEKLIKSLECILFTDSFDLHRLTVPEKKLFTFCNNPDEWEQSERTKRSKAKTKFESLICAKGKYKFFKYFTRLLRDQISLMSLKTCNNFTKVGGLELQQIEKLEMQQFYHLSIGENCCNSTLNYIENSSIKTNAKNDKYQRCLVTGLPMDLEAENKTVRCIGVSTVRWLKSNNIEVYNTLKAEWLSKVRKRTKKEPDEVTQIAKQIRNKISNATVFRDSAPRKVPANQLTMFSSARTSQNLTLITL